MISCRRQKAQNGSEDEQCENDVVWNSEIGVLNVQMPQNRTFPNNEGDGWQEVGVNVDALVVEVQQAADRCCDTARHMSVTMSNVFIVPVPFGKIFKREKLWIWNFQCCPTEGLISMRGRCWRFIV